MIQYLVVVVSISRRRQLITNVRQNLEFLFNPIKSSGLQSKSWNINNWHVINVKKNTLNLSFFFYLSGISQSQAYIENISKQCTLIFMTAQIPEEMLSKICKFFQIIWSRTLSITRSVQSSRGRTYSIKPLVASLYNLYPCGTQSYHYVLRQHL